MKQPRILIIDDSELNRKLVKAILKSHPFELLFAETAEEGLELARSNKPDLILMDVRLPGMDGLAATRVIRGDEELRQTVVVAFTAHAMRGDREKAFAAGCDGYITKPVDTRTFAEQLHGFLSGAGQVTGPEPAWTSAVRVLLAGGEPSEVKSLKSMLSTGWFAVEHAATGSEALHQARLARPDVVIVDREESDISGMALLGLLKSDPDLKSIPVIMITPMEDEEWRVNCFLAGAEAVMARPLEHSEVHWRVHQAVEAAQVDEQLGLIADALRGCGIALPAQARSSRVLVVDDEPNAARILEYGIRDLGCRVYKTRSGAEALARASEGDLDLVLLDLVLPDMDGLEIARRLQDNPVTSVVPFMVVSVLSDEETRARAFGLGASEVLRKPVNDTELCHQAARLFERKKKKDRLRGFDLETLASEERGDSANGLGDEFARCLLEQQLRRAAGSQHPVALIRVGAQGAARPPAAWAGVLRRFCRPIDWTGRLDNGDLGIIMPYVGPEADAIAEAFLDAVQNIRLTDSGRLVIPRIGLAVSPLDGKSLENLWSKALRYDWGTLKDKVTPD